MLASKLLSAAGGTEQLFVDDCFATTLYTGSGSAQTITNGIDLAGKGGLVWIKSRVAIGHGALQDTERGASNIVRSSLTNAQSTGDCTSFTSSGFALGNVSGSWNTNSEPYASWTFRKAARFFDCGTFSTNSSGLAVVSHSLGIRPGMVVVKCTSNVEDWYVGHVGSNYVDGNAQYQLKLNTTGANLGAAYIQDLSATSFLFSGPTPAIQTYVWYAFAHDTSAEGIIQCGSFTTDASGNATVNHGWSAGVQFAKIKASSTTGDWEMFDSARSPAWSTDNRLRANLSNAEDTVTRLSASGTSISFTGLSASQTYIYVFIVAPT